MRDGNTYRGARRNDARKAAKENSTLFQDEWGSRRNPVPVVTGFYFYREGKTYAPNGAREVARRLSKQAA